MNLAFKIFLVCAVVVGLGFIGYVVSRVFELLDFVNRFHGSLIDLLALDDRAFGCWCYVVQSQGVGFA